MKQTLAYPSRQFRLNYTLVNISLFVLTFILTTFLILGSKNILQHKQAITSSYQGYKIFTPKYYFGVDVDMSELFPGSKNYVVNNKGEDLTDIAANLGINTFRIMNNGHDSKYSYSEQQWDTVLRKMNSKGIKAIILNESPISTFPNSHNISSVDHLNAYIIAPEVCNNPDVVAIDISNEPDLTTNNLHKLKTEAQLIKAKCPNAKVTIGGWKTDTYKKDSKGKEMYNWNNPKDSQLIKNVVDMYAPHIYGFDQKDLLGYPDPYELTTNYLTKLKQYGGNKPILIDEFGAGNGQAFTDQTTLGSQELQANVYQGVLQAASDQHIMGATSYLFYPRSSHPEGWNILSDHGNTVFPAAEIFHSFTSHTTSIKQSNTTLPQDIILTEKNNNQTIIAKRGASIGIHISGDSRKKYTVQTDTAILRATEPLSKGWQVGKYDIVFSAIQSGKEKIVIKENAVKNIFSVTIVVK